MKDAAEGKVRLSATHGLGFPFPANANLLLDRQVNAIVGVDVADFRTDRTCRLRGEAERFDHDPSEDLFKCRQAGGEIGDGGFKGGHAITEGVVLRRGGRCGDRGGGRYRRG